jgi:predicted RecA/RadA family phage recombinase
MQAIYRSGDRTTVDYTAPETDVAAGSVVIVGSIAGVDSLGTPADELGSRDITGVFEVAKITETAFAVGATVYWNATADPVGDVAETGAATANVEDVVLGECVLAAAEDAATVWVKVQQDLVPTS